MIAPTGISAGLAASAQSLDQLRAQARDSPDQALKAAAQQFEAVFMGLVLKSMREATPQEGAFDSEQTRMFTGMLDQQLAQSMANRGVGLADLMVKQLSRSRERDAANGPLQTGAMQLRRADALPAAYRENLQQDFVRRLMPYADQASRETGVPASLILGQAALESGWGQREILLPDGGNSFNLFGIKAGCNWNGKVAHVRTTEYRDGAPVKQTENFRAYGSYAEAFGDYARLLSDNPRYAQMLQEGQTASGAAYALQRAGYATDPDYAGKLVRVMRIINALT
ncbi:MAG: flagellar assembly peptidoglycan hydrolase FlgJ [Nitrosomonadales bacterium]|nr:flagellar assembly peptidoglycan hydrolase FlgJ [Nitrosomonadales bacterium]